MDVVERTFKAKLRHYKNKPSEEYPGWLTAALSRVEGTTCPTFDVGKGEDLLFIKTIFMSGLEYDITYSQKVLNRVSKSSLLEYCLFTGSNISSKRVRRASTFVIMPVSPDRIISLDDSPEKCQEVGQLAIATISYLTKHRVKAICPVPIILGDVDGGDPQALLLKKNCLSLYADVVQAEKQLMLTFLISAHEGNSKIGACWSGMYVDEFSKRFIETITNTVSTSTPFVVSFHICRCADITATDFGTSASVEQAVMDYTFIGKFYTSLISAGYTQAAVEGYQGFFSYLTSHKAAVCTINNITTSHEKAMVKISKNGVRLPSTVYVINEKKEYIPIQRGG